MKSKIDRAARVISGYESEEDDWLFWQKKSPEERVAAVDILRQRYYEMINGKPERLKRVYKIIKRK